MKTALFENCINALLQSLLKLKNRLSLPATLKHSAPGFQAVSVLSKGRENERKSSQGTICNERLLMQMMHVLIDLSLGFSVMKSVLPERNLYHLTLFVVIRRLFSKH